jgi:hypothetical protein
MDKFWEKRSSGAKRDPRGRRRKFATPEQLWEEACEYFEDVIQNPLVAQELMKSGDLAGTKVDMNKMRPFTIKGLCLFLGVNTDYLTDLRDSLKGKDDDESLNFLKVIQDIEVTVYNQKFDGAVAGFFTPSIISRDLGLVEKVQNDTTIKVGIDAESDIEYE